MADYHAVLKRTLSGFSDPKPQLRSKLYDRARTTIQRQLEGRTPPVSDEAMNSELAKLESAITSIERGYDPSYSPDIAPEPAPDETNVVTSQAAASAASAEALPEPETVAEAPQASVSPPVAKEASVPDLALPEMDVAPAPFIEEAEPAALPVTEPTPEAPSLPETDPLAELEIQPLPEPANIEPSVPVDFSIPVSAPENVVEVEPDVTPAETITPAENFDPFALSPASDDVVIEANEVPAAQIEPTYEPVSQQPASVDTEIVTEAPAPPTAPVAAPVPAPSVPDTPQVPASDPIEEWAREFMNGQEQTNVEPARSVADQDLEAVPEHLERVVEDTSQQAPPPPVPQFEPDFTELQDEALSIPPAPGFGGRKNERPRKRGFFKWLLVLVLMAGLAVLGYLGWTNQDTLIEKFGLTSLFDDSVRPKPVKTISIKPDPEPETDEEPEAIAAATTQKSETRLGANGEEAVSSSPNGIILPPTATERQPPANTQSNGLPPVSQRAILYEEGKIAAENTVDSGRVIWSVVEEEPSAGEPKEPAIRGRVEVPSRNLVLILTIKRNSDRALPASHLIELVFAVPDDFSGGAIGQVSRFVLKENEQGRGDGLVGVPARIADGIFLIALNNLEQAVKGNEQLLKSRDWIDIPLQYRTGRRALITIEKGLPGDKVFKEVFEAWNKL